MDPNHQTPKHQLNPINISTPQKLEITLLESSKTNSSGNFAKVACNKLTSISTVKTPNERGVYIITFPTLLRKSHVVFNEFIPKVGNKIPSTTCVGSQVRFDHRRATMPIVCSLQMFVTISRVKSWIFIYLYACNSRV